MTDWRFCVPQLPARDVEAAQRWYRDVLGLNINWRWETSFGSVGRDHVELFLYETDDPQTTRASVFVDDADALYEAVRDRGADIADPLASKPWGIREFSLRDPDGNILRVGHAERTIDDIPQFTIPEEVA